MKSSKLSVTLGMMELSPKRPKRALKVKSSSLATIVLLHIQKLSPRLNTYTIMMRQLLLLLVRKLAIPHIPAVVEIPTLMIT